MSDAVFDRESTPPAELADGIRERAIDVAILAWWQLIITEPMLSAPRIGFLNFHPSLLPYNRGRHSAFWNLAEDLPFGVTIHWIDRGIDSGPIAFQQPIAKSWTDTAATLYQRAEDDIVDLFRRHLPDIAGGRIPRQRQDVTRGNIHYAKEIRSATRIELDKPCSARQLFNIVRASQFPPHAPAWFEDGGDIVDVRVTIERRQA